MHSRIKGHWRMKGLLGLAAACALAGGVNAATYSGRYAPMPQIIDNNTSVDVNNISMFVTNHGSIAYDLPNSASGLFFPKGTSKTAVYAAGLWVGAKVRGGDGTPQVTVGEYSQEYGAGVMNADGSPASEGDSRFRVYKIDRGITDTEDYLNWPAGDGAPVDSAGNPALIGDQTLWAVYNDADSTKHTNDAGNSDPLGLEVQQTVFGFARQEPLGNMVFVKWKFINKGKNFLDDTFVSVWSDPDLGGAGDDLVGCDTTLSLGYCYNATNEDELYGSAPPAVGFDFFQGPIVPSPGDTASVSGKLIPGYRNLPMTSFNKYINGTDPGSPVESYNYMNGLLPNGDPYEYPANSGNETKFFHSGDPVAGTGDRDDNPSDRRLMLSSGPFTMAPGDTQEVVVAIIVSQGSDRLSSIGLLKQYDAQAQAVFDLNFRIPPPPPRPNVYARGYDRKIDLIWGTEADGDTQISDELDQEFHFQGYNVWQGESNAGPWKLIATFDEPDSIALIYSDVFDVTIGGTQKLVVQRGTNNGIEHHLVLDSDQILGGPLVNYKEYFYAVTAYSAESRHIQPYFVGLNQVGWQTESLENPRVPVVAIPKASTATLDVSAQHLSGVSDGSVEVAYVSQNDITGHDYRVNFFANPDPEAAEPFLWRLTDVATGEVVLDDQVQQTEDFEDPIVDGMIVNVIGPPLAVKSAVFATDDKRGRWLGGVNFGLSGFSGGIGLGFEFQGSTLTPPEYSRTYEIRFDSTGVDVSNGPTLRRDQGYAFGGIGQFPGSVWDVTSGTPRRVNVGFVEDNNAKPANQQWDPDDSGLGGREYLFLMASDYNGGVDYGDGSEAHPGPPVRSADVVFAAGLLIRAGHTFLESNATFTITANYINTDSDVFEFSTHPVGDGVGSVIDNDLNKIHAVPNPYFNQSAYELTQFDRIVRFINLPNTQCTIRIFNLAGDLVRTLEKTDRSESFVRWDLETQNGFPVASGIYVYHVEAKGLGTKTGKLAVFVEKERLNRF